LHGHVTRHGQQICTGGTQKFKHNKNKEYEKTQKQLNEIIGALINTNWNTDHHKQRDKWIKGENWQY
jgi:hypothetical protein